MGINVPRWSVVLVVVLLISSDLQAGMDEIATEKTPDKAIASNGVCYRCIVTTGKPSRCILHGLIQVGSLSYLSRQTLDVERILRQSFSFERIMKETVKYQPSSFHSLKQQFKRENEKYWLGLYSKPSGFDHAIHDHTIYNER